MPAGWYETLPPPASVSTHLPRLVVFSCVAKTSATPAGFRQMATPYAVLDLTGLVPAEEERHVGRR